MLENGVEFYTRISELHELANVQYVNQHLQKISKHFHDSLREDIKNLIMIKGENPFKLCHKIPKFNEQY